MSESKQKSGLHIKVKNKLIEIYNYRNFIRSIVTKNLFGRYRNSYLGFTWNFITPGIYLILCYFIMTELRIGTMENQWLFLSSSIFAFSTLTGAITSGGQLFIGNSNMIKKMYFPREILAIANAISSIIVAIFGNIIVFLAIFVSGVGVNVLACMYLPLIYGMVFIFYIGCSLLLGSISVYVRDFQFFLGSMGMIFFVCTPIRMMRSDATGLISLIFDINPLTYFVEPLHEILYYKQIPSTTLLCIEIVLSVIMLILGYAVFKRLKRGFVERM